MTAGMLMQGTQGRAEPPVQRHDKRLPCGIPPCFKVTCAVLKHPHNEETSCYCPQTFLALDFQCRDNVSGYN